MDPLPGFPRRPREKAGKARNPTRVAESKWAVWGIRRKGGMGRHGGDVGMRDTTPSMSRGEFRRMGKGASVMWSTCECDGKFLIFDF